MNHFRSLGQKLKHNFVRFLVQMRTRKFAFEIYWPLELFSIYVQSSNKSMSIHFLTFLKINDEKFRKWIVSSGLGQLISWSLCQKLRHFAYYCCISGAFWLFLTTMQIINNVESHLNYRISLNNVLPWIKSPLE